MFELAAHSNESAVEVMAAITAQIARMKTVGEHIFSNRGISGLVPAANLIFLTFANIPKSTGMLAKDKIKALDKNAEKVAVNLFFAAKKRCAKSCSMRVNSMVPIKVGKTPCTAQG